MSKPATRVFLVIALIALGAAVSESAKAGDSSRIVEARIYGSAEDRRDAGVGTDLNDWLSLSGLLEVELAEREDRVKNGVPAIRQTAFVSTIQLGLKGEFSDSLNGELLFETEWDDGRNSTLDEAFLNWDRNGLEIEAGRLYVPFGRFNSFFITGPLLEFAETRGTALVVSQKLKETLEISVFAMDGETANDKKKDSGPNWGLGINFASNDGRFDTGAGYLFDLSDAKDVADLEFTNPGRIRVAGLTAYARLEVGKFQGTAELIGAVREFAAFDSDVNQPRAWNFELGYAVRPNVLIAIRIEGSDELAEEPKRQAGVSASWRINRYISLSAEYLVGSYQRGFVSDDMGNPLSTRRRFGIQIAAEF